MKFAPNRWLPFIKNLFQKSCLHLWLVQSAHYVPPAQYHHYFHISVIIYLTVYLVHMSTNNPAFIEISCHYNALTMIKYCNPKSEQKGGVFCSFLMSEEKFLRVKVHFYKEKSQVHHWIPPVQSIRKGSDYLLSDSFL